MTTNNSIYNSMYHSFKQKIEKTLYNLLSKNRHQCGHGGVAIRHVLPFLWTTPYLHITARNKSCENDVHST